MTFRRLFFVLLSTIITALLLQDHIAEAKGRGGRGGGSGSDDWRIIVIILAGVALISLFWWLCKRIARNEKELLQNSEDTSDHGNQYQDNSDHSIETEQDKVKPVWLVFEQPETNAAETKPGPRGWVQPLENQQNQNPQPGQSNVMPYPNNPPPYPGHM